MAKDRMQRAVELAQELYRITGELSLLFPGRSFTPDGHLVGSLGEVWARHLFDLELLPGSTPTHDARSRDGRLVQVKATQGSRVALSSEPNHLIVLHLSGEGIASVVFNGPGPLAWAAVTKTGKNSQSPITLSKLKVLMKGVQSADQIPLAPFPPILPS